MREITKSLDRVQLYGFLRSRMVDKGYDYETLSAALRKNGFDVTAGALRVKFSRCQMPADMFFEIGLLLDVESFVPQCFAVPGPTAK